MGTILAEYDSLRDINDDQSFGNTKLAFNGDFGRSPLVVNIPGWEEQGGGGNGWARRYYHWGWNQHLELGPGRESRRHNLLFVPPDATSLHFRLRTNSVSNQDRLKVYLAETLILDQSLFESSSYYWQTAVIPASLRGTSSTLNFSLEAQGTVNSVVSIDDVGFYRVSRMVATVASPVFIHAYDASGNHTGPTSDTTWVAEIPGSEYIFESDTLAEPRKTIILPPPPSGTEYRFEIRSRNATGHFNFQIEDYTTGDQTVNIIFDTVAIQPNTVAKCTLSTLLPSLVLQVDLDGNGTVDTTLFASRYLQDFFIFATTGENGSINPQGTIIREYGDSVQFRITPDSAYRVEDVLVDSVSVGAVSQYAFWS